jgi:hypothetical protein
MKRVVRSGDDFSQGSDEGVPERFKNPRKHLALT